MKLWTAVAIGAVVQAGSLPVGELARAARPLEAAEVQMVLDASREAMTDRTFILPYPGRPDGPQVLMGGHGHASIVREEGGLEGGVVSSGAEPTRWRDYFTDVIEFTGTAARRCDGTAVPGELVITYEHRGSTDAWTVVAGATPQGTLNRPPPRALDILAGRVTAVSDAPRTVDGRTARPFTAPFSGPPGLYGRQGSSAPATQTLWIDVQSLLPARWDVAIDSKAVYSLNFYYQPFDLRPPEGVTRPTCIP